jgi:hypothetical protein
MVCVPVDKMSVQSYRHRYCTSQNKSSGCAESNHICFSITQEAIVALIFWNTTRDRHAFMDCIIAMGTIM